MASNKAKEEKRLGDLTTNTKNCMDTLKDYQKLGEKILKTAELCRKLETEKEKVLPFYQSDEVIDEKKLLMTGCLPPAGWNYLLSVSNTWLLARPC